MHLDFIILLLIILLLVFYFRGSSEYFDTYRNHDFGAYNVYKSENKSPGDKNPDSAALEARYTWSEKDQLGYGVYDWMYEAVVREKNIGNMPYAYRDVGSETDGVYDSKFSIMNGAGFDNYSRLEMFDPEIISIQFNGQTVSLPQKQY